MNRTGTYIAFDGLGKKDPSESDFKYYLRRYPELLTK